MESKRRRFTSEFRHEAVALAESLGSVSPETEVTMAKTNDEGGLNSMS